MAAHPEVKPGRIQGLLRTLKVGMVVSLSGSFSEQGYQAFRGAQPRPVASAIPLKKNGGAFLVRTSIAGGLQKRLSAPMLTDLKTGLRNLYARHFGTTGGLRLFARQPTCPAPLTGLATCWRNCGPHESPG